jgi:hypothetical protein
LERGEGRRVKGEEGERVGRGREREREREREERGMREREEERREEGREERGRRRGERREGKREEREGERICLLKVKGRSLKNSVFHRGIHRWIGVVFN